jgi:hypothetical protein
MDWIIWSVIVISLLPVAGILTYIAMELMKDEN